MEHIFTFVVHFFLKSVNDKFFLITFVRIFKYKLRNNQDTSFQIFLTQMTIRIIIKKMILKEILISNFHEKLRKLSLVFFKKFR